MNTGRCVGLPANIVFQRIIVSGRVVVRWQKGYALHAVIREIAALRTEFIYQLRLFEEAHPEFAMTHRLFASTTIHGILDYVICDGTDKFLILSQGKSKSIV